MSPLFALISTHLNRKHQSSSDCHNEKNAKSIESPSPIARATNDEGANTVPSAAFATAAVSATSAEPPPPQDSNCLSAQNKSSECSQCLDYLKRALDDPGSRPMSLLRAIGIVSCHGANLYNQKIDVNNEQSNLTNSLQRGCHQPTEDGRGLVLTLRKSNPADKISPSMIGSYGKRSENFSSLESEGKNAVTPKIESDDQEMKTSLSIRRRLTDAASLFTGRMGSSQRCQAGRNASDSVLTTSPALETYEECETKDDGPDFTTITIECQSCGSDTRAEAGARAYVRGPVPLSIILCSNRLASQREVNEVLIHELVHVYDLHSRQMDLRDCKSLAYSEVRAAREAECRNSLTSFTANICAKDKATIATKNMFPDEGRKCVCDVFDHAMQDHAPIDDKGKRNLTFSCANLKAISDPSSPVIPPSQKTFSENSDINANFSSPPSSDR